VKRYSIPELSVFFPAYNEEKNLKNTIEKTVAILKKVAQKWEILIINDGSKDGTGRIAQELAKKYRNKVLVTTHHRNRGYGAALKSGFYNSRYRWIAFTDSDGQFDFSEIVNFIKSQKETNADLVIGYYLKRQVSFLRILGTRIWQLAVFLLFGLKVKDIDCGFKLIRKKVIETIPKLEAERGPFISSELLIKSKKSGFKIVEIGVHHYPRKLGTATGTDLNVVFSGLSDLVKLWLKFNFHR